MFDIPYTLIRSKKRRRTLSLRIDDDGRVIVHVPHRTPESEIASFLRAKKDWIEKNLRVLDRRSREKGGPRRFVPGDTFLYLGNAYPLEVCERDGRPALALLHGTFQMGAGSREKAREIFVKWYAGRAKEIMAERVNHYRQQLKFPPVEIRITSAKSRYGSCSADNRLSFSWRLIMAPYPVIDYVIVHELAHIRHKNHSKRFWGFVESVMPDYRQQRHWLNENNHLLML
ncbi:MAG: WLM domain protein [Syntrophorhabdus sp. PtaU1.Bin058]|nr:MAG: WLM domain protein [Syntrophorhabdus sp. PtaU1.Bin058]